MKLSTILSVVIWALILSAIAMLSSCAKGRNANPFYIYYYTTNHTMPKLYIGQNGKILGKVPVLNNDPEKIDSTTLLCVTAYDASTELDGVDIKGNIVETFNYDLGENGAYKEGGGGYLLYDTWHKDKYVILIRINGQF